MLCYAMGELGWRLCALKCDDLKVQGLNCSHFSDSCVCLFLTCKFMYSWNHALSLGWDVIQAD